MTLANVNLLSTGRTGVVAWQSSCTYYTHEDDDDDDDDWW